MSGLWRNHPATSRQEHFAFANRLRQCGRRTRPTQADVLLIMLRNARESGRALSLPEIMAAGIAQHGARFNELRARGFVIENRIDRVDGAVHSRYWLQRDPERGQQP